MVNLAIFDIFGQFYPLQLVKKITDSNGFKKTHHENGKNSLKLLFVWSRPKRRRFRENLYMRLFRSMKYIEFQISDSW
jgi:hypothetical protein